jgi:hypothetical protein
MGPVSGKPPKTCIYPGCNRPVVPPHTLGGPPSAFCDLEEHNALTAHQERQRLEREAAHLEHDRPRTSNTINEEVHRG